MAILVCAATAAEIEPTIQFIQEKKMAGRVNVLITGVGLLNAAYHIARASFSKPHAVLQAGVAGCFDTAIPLGTTAAILRETVGDLGVLQNNTFTSAFGMGLLKADEQPWAGGKLQNPHTDLLKTAAVPLADAVTVNEISTADDRISYYKNSLGATAESMEGAALHYVCLMEGIPFLQLRSFSNYVGERNKEAWRLREAIEGVNRALQNVLLKLM